MIGCREASSSVSPQDRILADAGLARDDVDLYLMHQATLFMLEHLRDRLKVDEDLLPADLEQCGNTVSSTLPILMHNLRRSGRLRPGKRSLLVGFGVGFSWAGCLWAETWQSRQRQAETPLGRKAA